HNVMRDAGAVRDEVGIGDGVEQAAGAVGDRVAVAEQLHRRPDDIVSLLDQHRRGDGAVHAARHGDEHPTLHRCSTAASARTFSTILGSAAATASTSSAVLSRPNENRSAATPSSRGTPIAVSTCEGSIEPVLHADPDEQATPARSKCMSSASLSVPGIDTLDTC